MASWTVLLTARALSEVGTPAFEILKAAGCKLIIPAKKGPLPPNELLPQLEGIDAALCSPDRYSPEVFAAPEARSLKIVSRWGVGYDSIDVPAATEAGVVVAYCPGILNDAVADCAFALLASAARRIHEGHMSMRAGRWAA